MNTQLLTILLELLKTSEEDSKRERALLVDYHREKEKILQEEREKSSQHQRQTQLETLKHQQLAQELLRCEQAKADKIIAEQKTLVEKYRFALEILSEFELSDEAHGVIKKALNSDKPPQV